MLYTMLKERGYCPEEMSGSNFTMSCKCWVCHCVILQLASQSFGGGGALKMREWKMREHIAGVENAGVENAGATKYGKPSEKNTLKHQTKYGCRGFLA